MQKLSNFIDQISHSDELSVAPLSLLVEGRMILCSKFRYELYKSLAYQSSELPLISCLMVTRRRFELAKLAIKCFQDQSYTNKELIIIDYDENDNLTQYINQLADDTIRHIPIEPREQTLGELRNFSLENASGDYVCTWDDDDLANPKRLEMQFLALHVLNAEACFLPRLLMWWVNSERMAKSRSRIWENSMLCRKDHLPLYPLKQRGEDTPVTAQIVQNCRVALLDQPHLYLYAVHQKNTCDGDQFETHWKCATVQFSNRRYKKLIQALDNHVPVMNYLETWGKHR